MYRKHFGLTRHPFDKDLAPGDLFPSASLLELKARLKHLIDMRGIGLVTGDSGSGKTTTCRSTVADLHSGLYVSRQSDPSWRVWPKRSDSRAGGSAWQVE